jgi:hypothetical protein
MQVELLYPKLGMVDLEQAVDTAVRGRTAAPFAEEVMRLCDDISRRIMAGTEARHYPELLALGFWIRKAELHRLRGEFGALDRPDRVLAPSGTVFHLPPRNVDTMFVYSWLLSALTGNRNVIRLSPLRSQSTDVLLRLFSDALAAAGEAARNSTLIVSYGHEDEPTAAFSAVCDVRVVWGGDATIRAIRRAPLPVHGRELAFPDRYSFSALRSKSYLALAEKDRDGLADRFFNDTFWFDQLACSAPRAVLWCGAREDSSQASSDFFPRVSACARRRNYPLSGANSMQKLVFAANAVIDRAVRGYRRWPELTVLTLESLAAFDRSHPGGGVFFEAYLESLGELSPVLERKDQTLTAFGFEDAELRAFIQGLNGRAIDRVVPFGQALQFGRFWDGRDLLLEFCRHVYLDNTPLRTIG